MLEREYKRKLDKLEKKTEKLSKTIDEKQPIHKQKKLTTSKIVLYLVILLNLEIVFFVEFIMAKWGDFSAVYALIGIPATLIPVIWSYYSKSKAENTEGGIVYDKIINNSVVNEFKELKDNYQQFIQSMPKGNNNCKPNISDENVMLLNNVPYVDKDEDDIENNNTNAVG